MKAVGMSDIGKCRKNNEDAYYISAGEDPAENLYLVADGMGGCNAGEVASSSAIEAFLAHNHSDYTNLPIVLEGNEACYSG